LLYNSFSRKEFIMFSNNLYKKITFPVILLLFLFVSGCACNKTNTQGYLKGALLGGAVGAGGGYAVSDDPNDDGKYMIIGAAVGAAVGGIIGAYTNICEQVTVAEELEEVDSDGDGVNDRLDQCPDTPAGARVDFKGCPVDTDKDGVYDYEDECPDTPAGARVDFKGCPLDTDKDGVPDYLDKCPDTPDGVDVDSDGCPVDTDMDGVADYKDKCPGTPEGAKVDERGCWVLRGVNFDTNKATIKTESYPVLDEVVDVLKRNPDVKLEIQGHTDSTGNAKYNQTLSEKRAKSVDEYFVSHGVNSSQLSYKGYGEEYPVASNDTDEGRAKNRRVELKPVP
jgi:outer membrane protein OmpA-like peptidoglycan-associated protein